MPPSEDVFDGCYDGLPQKSKVPRTLGFVAATMLVILAVFFGGEYVQRVVARLGAVGRASIPRHRAEFCFRRPAVRIVRNTLFDVPVPGQPAALAHCGLNVYDLRISPENLRELQATARRVSAQGDSVGIPTEYVPAQVSTGGSWVPIEVKLRGLTDSHYMERRPSLRLKFPANHAPDGKTQINLSYPYDKGLTIDLTTNWELRRHQILCWDSRFVVLRLNGRVVGLFQEIEQFGRSMIDRNGRPEGYIFSGNGQLYGKETGMAYGKARRAMDLAVARLQPEDRPGAETCDEAFFQEYFDTDQWAWAGAMTTLLASGHGWDGENLRLYWNPARGKFEPIPWDYNCFALDADAYPEGVVPEPNGYRNFEHLPAYRRMRDRRLWILLSERVDEMIAHSESLYADLENILPLDTCTAFLPRSMNLRTGESIQAGYVRDLRDNRRYLTSLFERHDLRVASWDDADGHLVLDLHNHGKSFLEVQKLLVGDGGSSRACGLKEPIVVDGLWQGRPGRCTTRVPIPPGAKLVGLVVRDGVTQAMLADADVAVAAGSGDPPPIPEPLARPALQIALENVRVEDSKVIFGPGRVVWTATCSIPKSHEVVLMPGLDLKMGKGASLLVEGDLTAVGSEASPVRISALDPREPWGGVAVQGTRIQPRRVRLEHLDVDGGTGTQNDRTFFTSSFAVHDGIVVMHSCTFRNGGADDGINLKYCKVDLRDNRFEGSRDDAVDLDFCNATVVANQISHAGGDGLDFSGSDVLIEGNHIHHCADKGMSIGEKTNALIRDNQVADCTTGIAVKDCSTVRIRDQELSNLQVGIAMYVKKQTFGPSIATVENVTMNHVATRFLRDETCKLDYRIRSPLGSASPKTSDCSSVSSRPAVSTSWR